MTTAHSVSSSDMPMALPSSVGMNSDTFVSPDAADGVIPPAHPFRTLVLCFDGTGDQFDSDNSNIVQFFSMLSKDDPSQQMVYYQAGIGTYTIPEIATPFKAKVSKTVDMMFGNHLDAHVMGGYEFLMQNYEAGDKICIFGFSRGAYTARALAGMLHKVGLLPRWNEQQVPFAYKMYSQDDEIGWSQSTAFKKAFSINVDIEFVGVWDTVNSVGVIPHRLPFTKTNDTVRYFRQALSLDERRVRFKPNHYHRSTEEDLQLGVKRDEMPHSTKRVQSALPSVSTEHHHHHQSALTKLERQYSPPTIRKTDVEEVWFAGTHGDVGGGSVRNGTRNSLARISLRWMIRECFRANTGIMFHRSMFHQIGMDDRTLYPVVEKRPPPIHQAVSSTNDPDTLVDGGDGTFVSEEQEDSRDALCPMYDQLEIHPTWWLLEILPRKLHYQRDEDDRWDHALVMNMGAGRHIPRQEREGVKIKLHRTVKIRMEADGLPGGMYWPKANLKVEPEWVD